MDSSRYHIIGVVEDFHSYSYYSKVRPVVFTKILKEDYRYLSMRVRKGEEVNVHRALQDEWAMLYPEIPFNGGYQEDVWGNFEENMAQGTRFWWALASIVILIAALGLYGVVTLNVSGRVKEFSIRKILGAELGSLAMIITRQYILVFLVALIFAAPITYYLVSTIFSTFFIYYMPLNFSFTVFAGSMLVIILSLVVASQVHRLSKANPTDGLKVE